MARMPDEAIATWNAQVARRAEERESGLSAVVECGWAEDWLARCGDPRCVRPHHYDYSCVVIRRNGSEWPHACVTMGEDRDGVVIDFSKPQLAQLIADLTALFQVLP
jgi:hypothetical protein